MIKNIRLVLLDLDGVMFDTKKNMQMSWSKVQKDFVTWSNACKHAGIGSSVGIHDFLFFLVLIIIYNA